MPASFKLPQSQKQSHKISRQADNAVANQHEDENLLAARDALALVPGATGDTLHRSVLQLQRTLGNRATGQLIRQKATESTVQRVIARAAGRPTLATLFADAKRVVMNLMETNTFAAHKNALPAADPGRTETFAVAWANAATRAALIARAGRELTPENPAFLIAVEAYEANPSIINSVNIFDTFITTGSPSEINIDHVMRADYALARNQLIPPAAVAAAAAPAAVAAGGAAVAPAPAAAPAAADGGAAAAAAPAVPAAGPAADGGAAAADDWDAMDGRDRSGPNPWDDDAPTRTRAS